MYNLKKIRLEKMLSQEKLCTELEKIGCCITRSAYTKYENGSRELPCPVLIKLAEFYGVSSDEILGIDKIV